MFKKDTAPKPPTSRRNWPLIVGSTLVVIIALLAVFGPVIAPKDPREHKLIIQIGDTWRLPPYPAFTPGYPLGSDTLGRDLYSWLLWSVQPTMILVIIVAILRMTLGLVIGVGAGWSDRWPGRLFDGLIAAALSVPALIASLIVITAVGFRLGVWAFVAGLAITGWAETAQLVREQTRTIRAQEAIEAAHALGATSSQIFFLHILPQVMPMIWMLLAFEISNTLVTTAGLGFLGYYLGGAVFTEVEDFVYQRISGMPELGQMLATAWMVLDEPWAMVAAGTVVFISVLAFNLVGEGLQQRLTQQMGGPRNLYTRMAGDVLPWIDERITVPVIDMTQRRGFRAIAALLLIVIVSGGAIWWRGQHPPETTAPTVEVEGNGTSVTQTATPDAAANPTPAAPIAPALPVPGGHIYANEGHDPWQTRWVNFNGPMTSTVQWTFESAGFTGGPAIDAAGTLYVAAKDGTVYALDNVANVRWQTTIAAQPVGNPALAADGTLYLTDKTGLNAISPEGDVLWHFTPDDGKVPTGGPVVGPDGTVYYKSTNSLLALSPEGTLNWQTTITESASAVPPRLSPDGAALFWEDVALHTADGTPYEWGDIFTLKDGLSQVIIGASGDLYHRYDQSVVRVVPSDTANQDAIVFDGKPHDIFGSREVGFTPDERPWIASRIAFGMGFYWMNGDDGTVSSVLKLISARNLHVAGVDPQEVAYICADSYESFSECAAFTPENIQPLWRERLPGIKAIAGVAMAPGRLYVATWEGKLLAIGEADVPQTATGETGDVTPAPTPPPVDPGPAWAQPVVPGGHPWPMERHDAWGTLWTENTGPQQAELRWSFVNAGGFYGGPAIAADGSVYIVTKLGELSAYAPDGTLHWKVPLGGSAISGAPALDEDGTIYVTDGGGFLTAFSPDGKSVWRYHAKGVAHLPTFGSETRPLPLDAAGPATTGPIIAPDGTLYFGLATEMGTIAGNVVVRSEVMQAVSATGTGLLQEPPFIRSDRQAPRLLPDGSGMLWGSATLLAQEDSAREFYYSYLDTLRDGNNSLRIGIFNGANGRTYAGYLRTLESWFLTESGAGVGHTFTWEPEKSPGSVADAGATPLASTAGELTWILFGNGTFIWVDAEDEVLGPARFPLESMVIAIDGAATAYGCGSSMGRTPECMAYSVGETEPRWHITLEGGDKVVGGALGPGVLYVVTRDGHFYALGD